MNDRKWMTPAALFLAAQLVFSAALAFHLGFAQTPPWTQYLSTAAIFVLLVVGVAALRSARSMPDQSVGERWRAIWNRYRQYALAMGLFCAQFVMLTWAKTMMPYATPLWADVQLANADVMLLGRDAWRLLPPANMVIDGLYLAWLPVVACGFSALYFSRRRDRCAALLAFFLTTGLVGTLGQYLFPSGGPIFYERLGLGTRFTAMHQAAGARAVAGLLWQDYTSHEVRYASGISAFPSMHVAISVWLALSFRNLAAVGFAAFIFLASIMLGWHYAVDGLGGAAGAAACYAVAAILLSKEHAWNLLRAPPSNLAA